MFLEGFRFVSGFFGPFVFTVRAPGKKLKINFAGKEKVLTFAVPNETGLSGTRGAMPGGFERGGSHRVCARCQHISRSVSGGGEVLERY